MSLPFFYEENPSGVSDLILGEETSKHVAQVLRMQCGERLLITDGKGRLITAEILEPHKKHTLVKVINEITVPKSKKEISVAISLIKNVSRLEWFVEKAVEIGITSIIPLVCKRTEKVHFRYERFKSIMVSAMLQSRRQWLPALNEPQKLHDLLATNNFTQKFVAHCLEENKQELKDVQLDDSSSRIILIGPEGDFTPEEIESCISSGYAPVSLGSNRLRTETAGVVAAVLLNR